MSQGDAEKNSGGVGTESLVSREHGFLVGRELDAAVAERVMGWQRQPDYNYWMTFLDGSFQLHALIATWKPSTDIAIAMDIVKHFQRQGYMVSVNASSDNGQWWCVMYPPHGIYSETEYCDSAPEAICRAALHAVSTQAASEQKG